MVAQQLALRHPERVQSIVLGATSSGGPRAAAPDDDVLAFLRGRLRMRSEEAARASVPFNYGPRCRRDHAERIEEDIAQRLASPFSDRAYRVQLFAAGLHNCWGRLPRIAVPTLVVHGRHDRMVPVENGRILAERIPGARLEILDESGHLYPTEEPAVDAAIAEFLAARDEEDDAA